MNSGLWTKTWLTGFAGCLLALLAGCESSGKSMPATAVAARNAAGAEMKAPAIDPDADSALRASSKYLADARAFCVKAEVWEDVVLPTGQKVQTTKTLEIQEQRPDRLHVEVRAPHKDRGFWYRDRALTVLDRFHSFYCVVQAPGDIDKTIDAVEDQFGIEIPLADLLVADPYASAMEGVETADNFGKVSVLGVECTHLAFTGKNVDWQVWIQNGAKPLPRKIVINFKTKVGSPQYTAVLSDWDIHSPISDSVFTFVAPTGSSKIEAVARSASVEAGSARSGASPAK